MMSTMDEHPVVELAGVTKTYPSQPPVMALRECELRIDRRDYVAIMGPSGSGKSTLLNVLGLLDEPTTGEYRLDGVLTAGLSERARSGLRAYRIGFVFQAFHLVSYRTAVENVETGLLYQNVKRRERQRRAIEVLEQVVSPSGCGRRRRRCRVVSASASRWRGRWFGARRWCCATSRRAISIRRRVSR